MDTAQQLVVFWLGRQRFALPLAAVRRVVRAARVTPVPSAPDFLCGMIDVQGELIAVFDVRSRLGLPWRPIGIDDQFLIAHTPARTLALVVDEAQGLASGDQPRANRGEAEAPWLAQLPGVLQLQDGLILIEDLEKFLSPAESLSFETAMEGAH